MTRDEAKTAAWEIRNVRAEEYRVILFLLTWPTETYNSLNKTASLLQGNYNLARLTERSIT